eukprot:GGOE01014154.1.p1 GENE.GGOE01014154.1~~GGOE01014154.1.p1  ORF type:complete len:912 (-),score=231.80 GGOE01014154.1:227-2962(-)
MRSASIGDTAQRRSPPLVRPVHSNRSSAAFPRSSSTVDSARQYLCTPPSLSCPTSHSPRDSPPLPQFSVTCPTPPDVVANNTPRVRLSEWKTSHQQTTCRLPPQTQPSGAPPANADDSPPAGETEHKDSTVEPPEPPPAPIEPSIETSPPHFAQPPVSATPAAPSVHPASLQSTLTEPLLGQPSIVACGAAALLLLAYLLSGLEPTEEARPMVRPETTVKAAPIGPKVDADLFIYSWHFAPSIGIPGLWRSWLRQGWNSIPLRDDNVEQRLRFQLDTPQEAEEQAAEQERELRRLRAQAKLDEAKALEELREMEVEVEAQAQAARQEKLQKLQRQEEERASQQTSQQSDQQAATTAAVPPEPPPPAKGAAPLRIRSESEYEELFGRIVEERARAQKEKADLEAQAQAQAAQQKLEPQPRQNSEPSDHVPKVPPPPAKSAASLHVRSESEYEELLGSIVEKQWARTWQEKADLEAQAQAAQQEKLQSHKEELQPRQNSEPDPPNQATAAAGAEAELVPVVHAELEPEEPLNLVVTEAQPAQKEPEGSNVTNPPTPTAAASIDVDGKVPVASTTTSTTTSSSGGGSNRGSQVAMELTGKEGVEELKELLAQLAQREAEARQRRQLEMREEKQRRRQIEALLKQQRPQTSPPPPTSAAASPKSRPFVVRPTARRQATARAASVNAVSPTPPPETTDPAQQRQQQSKKTAAQSVGTELGRDKEEEGTLPTTPAEVEGGPPPGEGDQPAVSQPPVPPGNSEGASPAPLAVNEPPPAQGNASLDAGHTTEHDEDEEEEATGETFFEELQEQTAEGVSFILTCISMVLRYVSLCLWLGAGGLFLWIWRKAKMFPKESTRRQSMTETPPFPGGGGGGGSWRKDPPQVLPPSPHVASKASPSSQRGDGELLLRRTPRPRT